jgi:hypothetical protein
MAPPWIPPAYGVQYLAHASDLCDYWHPIVTPMQLFYTLAVASAEHCILLWFILLAMPLSSIDVPFGIVPPLFNRLLRSEATAPNMGNDTE